MQVAEVDAQGGRDGGFNISGSDQACCVCAFPSRVPVGVRVLCVPQWGSIV